MFQFINYIQSTFFAPLDQYEPAGMFTKEHLLSLIICLIVVAFLLFISRNMKWEDIMKMSKILAIVITILELTKIIYNFYYGYTWLDSWLPLSFCSLFIYALWLSSYGNGFFKRMGDAYIVIGAVLGGMGFLLMPTTSLMRYPIWHFLCIYSLAFHSAMIYLGIMYIKSGKIHINRYTYFYFSLFFLIGASLSIIINVMTGSNIMILREPFNVPFEFIHVIQAKSQIAYTLLAMLAYLIGPGIVAWIASLFIAKKDRNYYSYYR